MTGVPDQSNEKLENSTDIAEAYYGEGAPEFKGAMELIEEKGVDSGLEFIKERSRGDEAFEKSVTRTVLMFSDGRDEFSRKAFPELFEK